MNYDRAAEKISKLMGKLKSSSGGKVKNPKQAMAIAMSESGKSLPMRGQRTAKNAKGKM
jgi:ribosomal protein S13